MYGMMYGMKKTTLYLPDALKRDLERLSVAESRSEAEIVREAVRDAVARHARPEPRIPLTGAGLGDSTASERVDELLDGFGQS